MKAEARGKRKTIAFLIAIAMIISLIPYQVFAFGTIISEIIRKTTVLLNPKLLLMLTLHLKNGLKNTEADGLLHRHRH